MKARIAIAAGLTALSVICATPAFALKYAEPEHNLKVDPASVGQHMADVAFEMARRGHRVLVYTSARGYENPSNVYPKQETIDDLKGLGRWVAFGILGALLLGVGVMFLAIGALRGHIDQIGRRITGWALDEARAEAPLCLDIYAGNELLGQVVANRYCAECAWIGNGRHGFEFVPPEGLAFAPGSVTVRRSRDGAVLSPSSALAQRLTRAQPRAGIRARR